MKTHKFHLNVFIALLLFTCNLMVLPEAMGILPTGWGTAELIETDDGYAYNPQVAVDSAGTAVAVWFQYDGTQERILAKRYVAGVGWGTAGPIDTDDGYAYNPQVAAYGSGNAVAVWQQSDGTQDHIWANRYAAGFGWYTAELIETDDTGTDYNPQVAINGSGNAVAVWRQSDGTRTNIWANLYVAGVGWGTAELIEMDDGYAYNPQVAVDSAGNAVAVWYQSYNIWANRYVAGVGWGTAELIETDDGYAYYPQVAVDGSGNAVAVWQQSDNIWANRYVAGVGWGTAELIEMDDGYAYYPQVAVDGSGNAMAVWQQSDGTQTSIWANRYVAGVGWGTAKLIETDTGGAVAPQVAVDGSGNAVAVWHQYDGTRTNIWANRYAAGVGWGTAELIEMDDGSAQYPQVAVDGSGNAVAVWHQYDGTRTNIWANRYVAGVERNTAITYQGRLLADNAAADGMYDMQFTLYDDPNVLVGSQVGSTIDAYDVDVMDGYFVAELDFGSNAFNGLARWLQIAVRPGTSSEPNDFVPLSPRQSLTPTPYAIYADSSDWSNLRKMPADFADGIDNIGLGSETDPQVGSNTTDYVPRWDGSALVTGTIYDNGNVGIGSTSPSEKLEVDGMVKATAFTGDGSGLTNLPSLDSLWTLSGSDIYYNSGNVGIGTASPAEELDVIGAVKANTVNVSTVNAGTVNADSFKGVPWRSPQWHMNQVSDAVDKGWLCPDVGWQMYKFMLPFDVTIEGCVISADDEANGDSLSLSLYVDQETTASRTTSSTTLDDWESEMITFSGGPINVSAGSWIMIKGASGNNLVEIVCWLYGRYNE